ncbi:D-glycero-alpha-D-manno-heptose-1,7-bisphosphate 7-phosphatase [Streptosporangium sandarakinum]|uniref:D-glycero-alpha-D-manno-heptose-1,7-bisphosphate 7-phosphatase n=1 Tax=Streptosporangium sandarakinum TaxID=1260955 RepID=UPI0033A579B0
MLFDRDGTLIEDVPYNADPGRVRPVPGARRALDRLRRAGVPVGVVTNQSGVARGLVSPDALEDVNRRVEELLGPFAVWAVCPHGEDDRCACRKPAPGLVLHAAAVLGVDARDCVVIGDIGRDVEAARAAGARGILVPTPVTLPEEVAAAPEVAADLAAAVDLALRPAPAFPDLPASPGAPAVPTCPAAPTAPASIAPESAAPTSTAPIAPASAVPESAASAPIAPASAVPTSAPTAPIAPASIVPAATARADTEEPA